MAVLTKKFLVAVILALAIGLLVVLPVAFGVFDPPIEPFTGEFESPQIDLEKWQVDDDGTCNFTRVDAPTRSGAHALRIDSQAGGRCEVIPWVGSTVLGRQQLEPFHEDRWYAFSVFLPEDWQPHERNEVIAQWHSSKDVFFAEPSGRGPPLALRIVGSEWRITYGFDADLISKPGPKAARIVFRRPIETGRWTDWIVRARWSWEDNGITEIWMNGDYVYSRVGPNAYRDLRGVYLKLGSYHPGRPRTLYLDRVRVQSGPPDAALSRR